MIRADVHNAHRVDAHSFIWQTGATGLALAATQEEGLIDKTEATIQRCRVHFMRNALTCVGEKDRPIVAAALRTVFDQDTQVASKAHCANLIETFRLHGTPNAPS